MTDATQNPTPIITFPCDTVNIPQTVKTNPTAAKITGVVDIFFGFNNSDHILLGASIPSS